jgi:hypothetical protein
MVERRSLPRGFRGNWKGRAEYMRADRQAKRIQ